MKQFSTLFFLLILSLPLTALPKAQELSTRELVGQTIMPRVIIGKHKAFKKAVQNGEVTGFFIKTHAGLLTHPKITSKNQTKFIAKQRKLLLKTITDLKIWAQQSPHKIPLLLAVDYEGGTVTSPMYLGLPQMPSNMLLAATQDENLVQDMYAAQAQQIRQVGANMALGPVADVNSNPKNPVIQTRSFGDQATNVGKLVSSAVEGLEKNAVAAVIKHFPGHGDTAVDSHYGQPITDLSLDDLRKNHIAAFEASLPIASGVMVNHVLYPVLDDRHTAVFSAEIIRGLLREQLNYAGIVFTDGLDMGAVEDKMLQDKVLDSYSAGNDILLLTGTTDDIKNSVRYPRLAADYVQADLSSSYPLLDRSELERSVQKILDLKTRLMYEENDRPMQDFEALSHRVAEQGVTLVRDTNKQLPLNDTLTNVCTVFLAEDIFSNQLSALNATLERQNKRVHTLQLPVTPSAQDVQQAQECARQAQVVIVGTSYKNKVDVEQYALATDLWRMAALEQKPFILISLLNPYEISLYPKVPTVLAVYGPTQATMEVTGEIITGQSPALGKLPVMIP